jgi:hypothetical protein
MPDDVIPRPRKFTEDERSVLIWALSVSDGNARSPIYLYAEIFVHASDILREMLAESESSVTP